MLVCLQKVPPLEQGCRAPGSVIGLEPGRLWELRRRELAPRPMAGKESLGFETNTFKGPCQSR